MKAIEARVKAANDAGRIANEFQPKLYAIMKQFVGKKIVTQQNELTAQVKKALADLSFGECHVWLNCYRDYSLTWMVKTCVSSETREVDYQHANYHECSMIICSVRDHVLTEMNDKFEPYKTDYSADVVIAAREAYKKAQAIADELKSALHPFGEYDR